MKKKKIMIVDDEAPFTRLLKLTLEKTGQYAVQVENLASRAVETAKEFEPDLVLMDVMMPEVDGGVLASQFQSTQKLQSVPIVFLTAAVRHDEVKEHHGLIGGLPFLAKPVDVTELQHCIQQHLRT